MQEIKKFGVLSVARVLTLFGLIGGLIIGLFIFVNVSGVPVEEQAQRSVLQAASQGVTISYDQALEDTTRVVNLLKWAPLFLPVLGAIIYFILGSIYALLYNLFSRWVGGIKVDLGDVKKASRKK